MAGKGTVTVRIVGDDSGLQGTLAKVESGFGGFAKKIAPLGAAIGGAFAVDKVVDFAASSVKAFAESEQASAKLSDAFSRFPKLADSNAAAFTKQAEALAKTTRFDDDATKTSQALLAQFKLTGAQIQQLTPLVQDYAAKTGKDLPQAAESLGKALLGKGAALKQIGVNFKDTGDAGKNFELVVGALSGKVGGFAAKEGATAAGQLAILKNRFGEVQEEVGAKLMPILTKLADFTLTKILPAVEKFSDWASKNAFIVGGTLAVAFGAWAASAAAAAVATIVATAPVVAIGAAVAGLAGGLVWAYKSSETFRTVVQTSFRVVSEAAVLAKDVVVGAFQFIVDKWLGYAEWITKGAALAFGWVKGIGGKLKTAAAAMESFRDDVNAALGGIRAWDPTSGATLNASGPGSASHLRAVKGQIEKAKPALKAAGGAAGAAFIDGMDSTIGGKAKATVTKSVKELAAEWRSQVGDMFGAFGAMDGRSASQQAVTQATESLNEALARQATLPVEIARARRELTAAQEDAAKTTDEEALAVVQARKRMLEAEKRYAELAKEATTTVEDLTEAEIEQRIARSAHTRATRDALAPTEAVTAAEQRLKDLLAEQAEITKAVTDAQAALTQAKLDSVAAELAYLEAAKKSNDITGEAVALFEQLALKAGLSRIEVDKLAGAFGNLKAGGGGAGIPNLAGPVGPPEAFHAPVDDPFPQLRGMPGLSFREGAPFVGGLRVSFRDGVPFAGGRALVPSFATGGVMPGPKGMPGLAMLHGGETILPTHTGGGVTQVTVSLPGRGQMIDPLDLEAALLRLNQVRGPIAFKIR